MKVKKVEAHSRSTHLDLLTIRLSGTTRKGFQARSRCQHHFSSPDFLNKYHNRGYKFFIYFIDLRVKQGSIWSVKKGTSLKTIHHSAVEESHSQDLRVERTVFG